MPISPTEGKYMRFSFAMIVEWVSKQLQAKPLFYELQADAIVKGVSVCPAQEYRNDWVYLLHEEELSNCAGVFPPLLILLKKTEEDHAERQLNAYAGNMIAVFGTDEKKEAVAELIQECYAYYNDWYDNLLYTIRNKESWFTVLEEGHKVLGNPIILYDRSMKVMAYTRGDGTDDDVWKDTVASGTARVETASEADELLKYVSKLDKSTEPFRHIGEGMSDPFYNCNVMVGGRRYGMVTVIEYHAPLSKGQMELLQAFANAIALRFQERDTQQADEDAVNDQLLYDLLSGSIASHDRLNTRLIASQWKYKTCFWLIRFTSRLSFVHETRWKQNLEELRRSGMNGIGCVIREGQNAICYLYTSSSDTLKSATKEILEHYCMSHHLRCGISSVFKDLLDTPQHDEQAAAALELEEKDIIFYEEVRFPRLIRYLKSAEYPGDLMHPAVLKLKDLDESTGAEYLLTLRALIENGVRQTDTAKALKIHRTTLIYRMGRIHDITGLDFSDSEEMIHLALSLKMAE